MDFKKKIEILVSEATSKGLDNLKKQLQDLDKLIQNIKSKAPSFDLPAPKAVKTDTYKNLQNDIKNSIGAINAESLKLGRQLDDINSRFGVGSKEATEYGQSLLKNSNITKNYVSSIKTINDNLKKGVIAQNEADIAINKTKASYLNAINKLGNKSPFRQLQKDVQDTKKELQGVSGQLSGLFQNILPPQVASQFTQLQGIGNALISAFRITGLDFGLGGLASGLLNLQSQVKATGDQSKTAQVLIKGLGTASSIASVGVNFLKGALGGIVVALTAVALAVPLAVKGFKEFGEAQKVVEGLRFTLDNTGKGGAENLKTLTDEAERLQNLTGVSDDGILASLDRIALANKDLNVDELKKLEAVIVGISKAKGLDVGEVGAGISKSLQGNAKFLKDLGINIDKNASKQEILNQLFAESPLLLGKAIDATKTVEGSLERLKTLYSDAFEKIGQGLFSSFDFSTLFNQLADVFSDAEFGKVAQDFGASMGVLAQSLTPLITATVGLIKPTLEFITQLANGLAPVLAFISLITKGIADLTGVIIKAKGGVEIVLLGIALALRQVAISGAIAGVALSPLMAGFLGATAVATAFIAFLAGIGKAFPELTKQITSFISGFAQDWGAGWQAIIDITKGSWDLIVGYTNLAIGAMLSWIGGGLGRIVGAFKGDLQIIKILIERFAKQAPIVFRSFAQSVASIFTALGQHIKNSFAGIIKAVLSGDIKALQGELSKALTGFKMPAIAIKGFSGLTDGLQGIEEQYAKAGEEAGKKWGDKFIQQGSKQIARGLATNSKAFSSVASRAGAGKTTKGSGAGNLSKPSDGAGAEGGGSKGGGGKTQKQVKSTFKEDTGNKLKTIDNNLLSEQAILQDKINNIEKNRLQTNENITAEITKQKTGIDNLELANKELDLANAKIDTALSQGLITEIQAKEQRLNNERLRANNEIEKANAQKAISDQEIAQKQAEKTALEAQYKLELQKLEAEKITNASKIAILSQALTETKDAEIIKDFTTQISTLTSASDALNTKISELGTEQAKKITTLTNDIIESTRQANNALASSKIDSQIKAEQLNKEQIQIQKEASSDMREAFVGGSKDAVKAFTQGDFAGVGRAIANAFNNFVSKSIDKIIDKLFNSSGDGGILSGLFGGLGGSKLGAGQELKKGASGNFGIFGKSGELIKDLGTTCGIQAKKIAGLSTPLSGLLGKLGSGIAGIFSGKGLAGFKEGGGGGGISGAGLGGILGIGAGVIGGIMGFIKSRKAKQKAKREAKLQAEIDRFKEYVDARLIEIDKAQELVSEAQSEFLANTPRGLAQTNKAIVDQLTVINSKKQDIINKFNSLSTKAKQRSQADFDKTIIDLDKQIKASNDSFEKNLIDIGKQLSEFRQEQFFLTLDKEYRDIGKSFYDLELRRFDLKEAGFTPGEVDKLIDQQITELQKENAQKFKENREELIKQRAETLKSDLDTLNRSLDEALQEFGFRKKATSDVRLKNAIKDFRIRRRMGEEEFQKNHRKSFLEEMAFMNETNKALEQAKIINTQKAALGGSEYYLSTLGGAALNQIQGYNLQIPPALLNQGVEQITQAINQGMANTVQTQFNQQFTTLFQMLGRGRYGGL